MGFLSKLIPAKQKRAFKERLGVPTLHQSLLRLRSKNFYPISVLDVGAYKGEWCMELLEVFPRSKVLMVEAQQSKSAHLEKIKKKYLNTDYSISLLSSCTGSMKYFHEDETASYILDSPEDGVSCYPMETKTLDDILEQKNFPLPDLLKLDVQGHEKEVLKGATKCLIHAEVCLLEITFLNIGDNNPQLKEMLDFMDKFHFQAYDISHFIRRPFDKALYQADFFIVKKDASIISEKRWA